MSATFAHPPVWTPPTGDPSSIPTNPGVSTTSPKNKGFVPSVKGQRGERSVVVGLGHPAKGQKVFTLRGDLVVIVHSPRKETKSRQRSYVKADKWGLPP